MFKTPGSVSMVPLFEYWLYYLLIWFVTLSKLLNLSPTPNTNIMIGSFIIKTEALTSFIW